MWTCQDVGVCAEDEFLAVVFDVVGIYHRIQKRKNCQGKYRKSWMMRIHCHWSTAFAERFFLFFDLVNEGGLLVVS